MLTADPDAFVRGRRGDEEDVRHTLSRCPQPAPSHLVCILGKRAAVTRCWIRVPWLAFAPSPVITAHPTGVSSDRNQVFRSKVFLRTLRMPAIVYILDAEGSKTWFLAASPGKGTIRVFPPIRGSEPRNTSLFLRQPPGRSASGCSAGSAPPVPASATTRLRVALPSG